VAEVILPRIGPSLGLQLLRLRFGELVKRIEALRDFVRDRPLLVKRTTFGAWLLAVTAISFCWFAGVHLPA
jgi:hypothetical protein